MPYMGGQQEDRKQALAGTSNLDLPASGTVQATQAGAFCYSSQADEDPVSLQEDSLSLLQTSEPLPAKIGLLSMAACLPLQQAFPSWTPLQGDAAFS